MRARRSNAGYALLMVCFLAALMIIAAAAAVPNLITEGKREKEEELIWRGEQYVRAIRLYYRKYGRFPQSFEDLTESKNQIRFLRKAYVDPVNRKDGSWRLIYVGPSGELIGSLKNRNLGLAGSQLGGMPPRAPGQRLTDRPGGEQRPPDSLPSEALGPAGPGNPPPTEAKSPSGEGKVYGGNIIGVASKVPVESIRIYKDGRTYREWEFIWNPAAEGIGPPGSRPQRPGPAPQVVPQGQTPPPQPPQ